VWHAYLPQVRPDVPEDLRGSSGLSNYWGYNTIGFFAPHSSCAASESKPLLAPAEVARDPLEHRERLVVLLNGEPLGGGGAVDRDDLRESREGS
jgi:hypothetical protein